MKIISGSAAFLCAVCSIFTFNTNSINDNSMDVLYHDVIITALAPAIDGAMADYYSDKFIFLPNYAVYTTDIKSIERPNGNRTQYFLVELEIEPYLGPHIAVGRDRLLIELKSSQLPKVLKFEHLLDYELPKHKEYYYRSLKKTVDKPSAA